MIWKRELPRRILERCIELSSDLELSPDGTQVRISKTPKKAESLPLESDTPALKHQPLVSEPDHELLRFDGRLLYLQGAPFFIDVNGEGSIRRLRDTIPKSARPMQLRELVDIPTFERATNISLPRDANAKVESHARSWYAHLLDAHNADTAGIASTATRLTTK